MTDALLEGAERGDALAYPWYQLPLARVMKGYGWALERLGKVGPIPEGMSAAAALRNTAYTARHRVLAARVRAEALRMMSSTSAFPYHVPPPRSANASHFVARKAGAGSRRRRHLSAGRPSPRGR